MSHANRKHQLSIRPAGYLQAQSETQGAGASQPSHVWSKVMPGKTLHYFMHICPHIVPQA